MSFTVDLSRFVVNTKKKQDDVIKGIMITTFKKVILKSPVDLGRFRNNWITGVSSPNLTTTTEVDKSGLGAIGRMTAEITAAKLDGKSIFLTNSLPYSLILENGRANGKPGSMQSPQGMVKITLMEISAKYGR